MSKGSQSTGHRVLCGCCISIAVVLLIFIVLASYSLLYMPDKDKVFIKLGKDESLEVSYCNSLGEASDSIKAKVTVLSAITNQPLDNFYMIEYKSKGGNADEEYGLIIYTDSLKTSTDIMIDYLKFIMGNESADVESLDYHVSMRGKAVFFGNMSADLRFRKIIF